MFLKNISLYGVQDLLHIVNSPIETKIHLKQLVENGIKDKIVSKLYEEISKTNMTSTDKYDMKFYFDRFYEFIVIFFIRFI